MLNPHGLEHESLRKYDQLYVALFAACCSLSPIVLTSAEFFSAIPPLPPNRNSKARLHPPLSILSFKYFFLIPYSPRNS